MAASTPPEKALAALAAWPGLALIDFDETLYLRNSTEDFLSSAQPAWLAARLLRLACIFLPRNTRDYWRIKLILTLFPGTMARWQASQNPPTNTQLRDILLTRQGETIILSAGYAPIIEPLLTAMGLGASSLLARNLSKPPGPWNTKHALIGTEALKSALVLTDSEADRDILEACATPLLTRWPRARFIQAFPSTYIPGDYLARIKRPGDPHPLRQLLTDDFCPWLLIACTGTTPSLQLFPGLACLFAAFWCVYEAGYLDNDRSGQKYEPDPVLSPAFHDFTVRHFEAKAWATAIALSIPGLWLLHGNPAAWAALLIACRALFALFNRLPKPQRVWLYPLLQFCRGLAPGIILPLGPVGILAGLSQITARWMGYFLYRLRPPGKFPAFPTRLVQLWLLLICYAALALTPARAALLSWPATALALWSLFLARKQFVAAIPSKLTRRRAISAP